jgi:hypothetical protein
MKQRDTSMKTTRQPLKPRPGPTAPKAAPPAAARPAQKRPAAPAVYRPQPAPRVLQAKRPPAVAPVRQGRPAPSAPPVYRPQPSPAVLQAKKAAGQPPRAEQSPRRPVAPPVYRPTAASVQLKPARQGPPLPPKPNRPAPPPPRPQAATRPAHRPEAMQTARPSAVRGQNLTARPPHGVAQRMAAAQGNRPRPQAVSPRGPAVIQRRLPAQNYHFGLFGAEAGNVPMNLQGIQNLLVRIYTQDLSGLERNQLELKLLSGQVDLDKALYQPPNEHTTAVYNWVVTLFPGIVYPGHHLSQVAPQGNEVGEYTKLVDLTEKTFKEMLVRGDLFAAVFGDGAGEAMGRTKTAWQKFHDLATKGGVFADKSGEQEEMMIGGHTKFAEPVILRGSVNTFSDTPQNATTLIHETMHHAHQDILDNGGYPGNPDDFRQRSVSEKLLNASHYEEVARRVLNYNPVGGDFIPAVQQNNLGQLVDNRTAAQKAAVDVTAKVRTAWERAQNVFGLLKVQHDNPNGVDYWTAILKWSQVLGLQIHDRAVNKTAHGMFVNYVDLLQVESLTKTLSRMMGASLAGVMSRNDLNSEKEFADAMLAYLADTFADNRWLTRNHLLAVIDYLSNAPRDVSTVS